MHGMRTLHRLAAYAWASPNTMLGVAAGLAMLCLGGRVHLVAGVMEFHGGLVGRFITALPGPARFGAITLGHVVLAVGLAELSSLRAHEHVHVRQYERWGVFFLPAYVLSSAWQVVRGRRGYRDNFFERQAYAQENPAERPGRQA